MSKLKNLKLEEFSIVRGDDLQPANPEATVSFYKAARSQKENSMSEGSLQNDPAATPKHSLAKALGAAIRDVITKAKTTRTDTYNSQSTATTVFEEPDPAGAAAAGEPTVIIVTDAAPAAAVDKTAPVEPAGDPIPGVSEVAKALEPLVSAVIKLDGRLAKVEGASAGSRAIAKGGALVQVSDNSDPKFGEFTKYLTQKSGLTAGQRLSKATLTSGGWSYGIAGKEADAFIDYMVDESTLLKLCRTIRMPDKKYNIDKVGLGGKVFVKATPGVDPGDTVSLNGPSQVQLDAEEVIAIVSIGDDTLEDNIEGEAFAQHLLGMISRSGGNELEQMGIHGDKDVADTGILDRLDGWLKLALAAGAHVTDAMADADRYWPGDSGKKMTKLLKTLPTKYRQDLKNMALLLHPDAYLDFSDMLSEKGYSDAFASITGIRDLPIRNVKNVQVPMLKTDIAFTSGGADYTDGTVQILTDLRNLIFGIHREIRLESLRQPRKRCTDYVLTMRVAVQIENGDAVAIYNHSKVK